MILGMSISAFTTLHVVISLAAIALGLVWIADLVRGRQSPLIAGLFLLLTILTSVTGFMFPAAAVTPAQIVGGISLVVLAAAVVALYVFGLRGIWRPIYVTTAILALYFNVFVGVVQAFQKIGPLSALAPTQSEPPFLIAQTIVLLLAVVAGWLAARRFRGGPTSMT
ncbi:MAG: hypothetical protein BGN89_15455 [Alphaproteobacteria bacterium 64-6]|uniref:hypothetical protein n=1 Tax=Hyphomicrobium sp. CS1BSMeth3 TaxID=1892844 RepID=UPI00092FEEAE|nr:hypothetical protein [Hyphomicrobium sp. CS1BSMeth3]MBN9259694.1 hypothetical protein [Hyphomicrobium sp.]MBN9266841.1 hypothetical protein [Hyphomicrobium sp.]OJU25153.1 MAG: hypothetical protein BGN89_15455 [Alphaproteobacteria bacterium 64-6]